MKNSELKDYMNDNRDAIAKASRLGVGLIIGAVIIIGVVFYGIAPKTKKKPDTSSSQVQQATDAEATAAEDEADNTTPTLEEMQKEDVPKGYLYRVTSDTPVLDKDGNYIGGAGEGELFSSYDPLALEDYGTDKKISIDYLSQQGYISVDDLAEVTQAVILPTAGDSFIRDEYNGTYAVADTESGAAAAAALVNSEKSRKWDKAELISARDVMNCGGDLVKLINSYSGGDLIAENISGDTISTLKAKIDEGKRVLISVRYDNGVVDYDHSDYLGRDSGTQYIVVCGYADDDTDGLYFYCCDPFYGQGGRSLSAVSAQTIDASAALVEPANKAMIVLR